MQDPLATKLRLLNLIIQMKATLTNVIFVINAKPSDTV